MAGRKTLVNLDAMIARADFAVESAEDGATFEHVSSISVHDFTTDLRIGLGLRKPDFQRETNHWTPEQVASLLECYVNGDLIPSVILWRSASHIFVIDGGHRLSVLRAWVEDDYGDGPVSQAFFEYEITKEQKNPAKRTRALINERIGSFQHYLAHSQQADLAPDERKRVNTVMTRALPIQWVTGNADRAEASFFKINTEGTPLDEIEELLLRSRRKPIAIAARAVIRAGKGHRYWSSFEAGVRAKIEEQAATLHETLFEPSLEQPIKILDLPLGGSKGVRMALQVLIDFMLIANRDQAGAPKTVASQDDDETGAATLQSLGRSLRLAQRVTGNDGGSLGLHPAVYFYGPTGRHSGPMFMGTMSVIAKRLTNNDKGFFARFTSIREPLENVLVAQKDLIATVLQKNISRDRTSAYEALLESIISALLDGTVITEEWLVQVSGLKGKLLTGDGQVSGQRFSDDAKSQVFISVALSSALRCPECNGYLNTEKSVSYDHKQRVREGGTGDPANCQLMHPYCNQAMRR